MSESRRRADICLVCEGTWPYVAGGVSTWIQQLMQAMPDLNFAVWYLGADPRAPRRWRYEPPPNLVELRESWLHQPMPHPTGSLRRSRLDDATWAAFDRVIDASVAGLPFAEADLDSLVRGFGDRRTAYDEVIAGRGGWEHTIAAYQRHGSATTSFNDFFWTLRLIAMPLLGSLLEQAPRAACYHSASTGYAGLQACRAATHHGACALLTEHGIYTRERRIEIFNAEWIRGDGQTAIGGLPREGLFKRWWTGLFDALARTAYQSADRITTLFEANRREQIRRGAPADRLQIIPNGIDLAGFGDQQRIPRAEGEPLRIAFVGRITAIKDVKTLIQAAAILDNRGVDFRLDLLGPLDEEPDYAAECRSLVAGLGLGARVFFQGPVTVTEWYPFIDLVVLTSISEGLPFIILEAGAAAVPSVATDVGACRDLIHGDGDGIGHGGAVCAVGDARGIADAIAPLAADEARIAEWGSNARTRVFRHYDIKRVMATYRSTYDDLLHHRRAVSLSGAG